MTTVSAPGKIHLMGEHAVVWGKPALLTAVNLRLYASVEENPRQATGKKIEIHSSEPTEYVRHTVGIVRDHFRLKKIPPLKITITSQIPAGYHLGSSAAVAVATVGAVTFFLKKIWNPSLINQLAYEAEKKQHGNPSGGDNTAVTCGGFLWYRRELEFLKSIWQLPFKPHLSLNHFFLINTGRPKETTGEMVEAVKFKVQSSRLAGRQAKFKMEKLFNQNETQVRRIAAALKQGDEAELIDAIRIGQRTLEGMGVVSRKVIPLIRQIEKRQGAAKILGGGGKQDGVGFLLCYHHEPKKIEAQALSYGYSLQQIRLGEEGVRLEEK